MRKIATVFSVGVILVALAGCVPGETVVTISADDVGCVMTSAISQYIEDVKNCDFPNEKEQY
jgi:hypothetical protein